jgi:hypothetical protein
MTNFNFSEQPEYTLNTTLTTEMINLYGIKTKFLVTEQQNIDYEIFGDFSHLKTDNSKIFDIYMLPENSEDWESGGYNFNEFGLSNFENVVLFVAKSSFDTIFPNDFKLILGCLVVLPNQKIMEITDVDPVVPGINNLFTQNDAKSVFKLTLIPYNIKLINELDNEDISTDDEVPYEGLDVYFDELVNQSNEQDIEMNVTPSVDTIDSSGVSDVKIQKPVVDTTEESIWGDLE